MIEYTNGITTQISPNQYQGKFSPGPIRFREDGGVWRTINSAFLQTTLDTWQPTDVPYRFEVKDNGDRLIYPDRQDLSRWLRFPRPSWLSGFTRTIEKNRITLTRPNIVITISAGRMGVGLEVVFATPPAFSSLSFPVDAAGLNIRQLLNAGRIKKPVLVDALGNSREVDWTYTQGQLTVNLDFSGLTFPVVLDPTFAVAASADDVYRWGTTSFSATSTAFPIGNWATGQDHSAARFINVNIPNASIINSSTLTIVAINAQSGSPANSKLFAEDADNAAQITSYSDYDGRVLTAGTAWSSMASWVQGNSYTSPDFSADVQVVVNRAGWVSGNALNIFWKDNNSGAYVYRQGASWDNTSYTEPVLTVTWTAGGVTFVPRIMVV